MYTQPFAVYMRKLLRWILRHELSNEYDRGWSDGVNQHHYEPSTAEHGIVTRSQYWGEE